MADIGKGMTVTTYKHGNAEIVVYRRELTPEEEAKKNRQITVALERFGKELYWKEGKMAD